MRKDEHDDTSFDRGSYALLFVIVIFAVFFAISQSKEYSSGSGGVIGSITEVGMTDIDSIKSALISAPRGSVIEFSDGDLDIIDSTNEQWVFLLNSKRTQDYVRSMPMYQAKKVKRLIKPDDPCYSVMLANAVQKIIYRGALDVEIDTVGTKECPHISE